MEGDSPPPHSFTPGCANVYWVNYPIRMISAFCCQICNFALCLVSSVTSEVVLASHKKEKSILLRVK